MRFYLLQVAFLLLQLLPSLLSECFLLTPSLTVGVLPASLFISTKPAQSAPPQGVSHGIEGHL